MTDPIKPAEETDPPPGYPPKPGDPPPDPPQPAALLPHQQRVVDEKAELSEKVTKLEIFLGGGTYASLPAAEQTRLSRQFLIMQLYEQVLSERISSF
jgi:hypothetical protein